MSDRNEVDGMTDLQYKGMLLDQLYTWKQLQNLAAAEEWAEIRKKIQREIDCINLKLQF